MAVKKTSKKSAKKEIKKTGGKSAKNKSAKKISIKKTTSKSAKKSENKVAKKLSAKNKLLPLKKKTTKNIPLKTVKKSLKKVVKKSTIKPTKKEIKTVVKKLVEIVPKKTISEIIEKPLKKAEQSQAKKGATKPKTKRRLDPPPPPPTKRIKTILVSQPKPESEKSPYYELAKKHGLKIDFRPFIQVEPLPVREFRNQRANMSDFTAIIFNSKNAVDVFLNLMKEMKITLSEEMKYFCVNDGVGNYLTKFLQLRKRKLFYGKGTEQDLLAEFKKHPNEKYFFPCSDIRKNIIPDYMKKNKITFSEGMIYRIKTSDLSDLADVYYDIICFFSPADIKSLFDNFPDFKQRDTSIAAWGQTTIHAAKTANLLVNVPAPSPESPSMVMALEKYVLLAKKIIIE